MQIIHINGTSNKEQQAQAQTNKLLGKSLFIKCLHYFVYFLSSTSVTERLRDLVVLLLCQQVVERFVDGLVVVTLDRPQVRLDQLQLVHLVEQKQPKSCLVNHIWHYVIKNSKEEKLR